MFTNARTKERFVPKTFFSFCHCWFGPRRRSAARLLAGIAACEGDSEVRRKLPVKRKTTRKRRDRSPGEKQKGSSVSSCKKIRTSASHTASERRRNDFSEQLELVFSTTSLR